MLLMTYSYSNEIFYAVSWFSLGAAGLFALQRATRTDMRSALPAMLVYLFLFFWARSSLIEAYSAQEVVGHTTHTEYEGGWLSDNYTQHTCQQPVFAHEGRGHKILWFCPFVAMVLAVFYDLARRTRHTLYLLLLFLPFIFVSYFLFGGKYVSDSDLKPCENKMYKY